MSAAAGVVTGLAIEGELSIYRAAELRQWLDASVPHGGELQLNLAGVTEFDTAGVQLLLVARRLAADRGCRLRCVEPSVVVQSLLALFDLGSVLGDAIAPPAAAALAASTVDAS